MDTRTVDAEDMHVMAVELRALHASLKERLRRVAVREARIHECLEALADYFGARRPPPRAQRAGTLLEAKAQAVRAALWASGGSKRGAARILEVNVKTVFNLMRQLGIAQNFGRRSRLPLGNDPSPSIRA